MFRAYESTRERLVAVKLFKLDLPPERVHQLVAELERIVDARLNHPAVATPIAAGIVGVSAYLAQEYVPADSLDSVVRDFGPAPPGDALRVAAHLAGALDFAGVVNIAHGALHPRDILLSSDETRLTGLGIARALERVGVVAPVRRPYTAPERVAGSEWDRRADVFSLAAVVHELLWARRPSGAGDRVADALTDVGGGNLDALRAAFARALAENPADRYATALEFAEALNAAFPSLTIAPPAPPGGRGRQPGVAPDAPQLPLLAETLAAPEPSPVAPAPIAAVPSPPLEPIGSAPADDPVLMYAAEDEQDQEVDAAPAIVDEEPPAAFEPQVVMRPPAFAREPVSALERSRSAVWPLVLALGVGLAVGFASGYGVGTHSRPGGFAAAATGGDGTDIGAAARPSVAPRSTAGQTATVAPPAAAKPNAAPPSGREFTESMVATPPKAPAPAPPATSTRAGTSQQSAATDGRLLVRSTPAGARVSVDGKEYGTTPATIRELTRGAHRVRVAREGYAAAERRIVLTPSQPAQSVTFALLARRPERTSAATLPPPPAAGRYTGTLVVDSRPAGANVFVDGQLAGTTPVSIPDVRAGEHAIRLEHNGYRRWSSSVRVVAAEQNRVTASLER